MVNQVNIVFNFLAEYHQSLKNDLNEHLTRKNEEETQYLIMKLARSGSYHKTLK